MVLSGVSRRRFEAGYLPGDETPTIVGMARRIGLYGGTFDPIHMGHLIVAEAVADVARLDRVLFLPSSDPPHKNSERITPGEVRAQMIEAAINRNPRFALDRFDLDRAGPTFTIDTVRHFAATLGSSTELAWIIGADSLAEISSWRDAGDLIDSCEVLTAARPGWEQPDWGGLSRALGESRVERLRRGVLATPLLEIAASEIRERIRTGRSIRYLVPESVEDIVRRSGLYEA